MSLLRQIYFGKEFVVCSIVIAVAALAFAAGINAQSKARSQTAAAEKAKNSIHGRWISDEATIEIRADGTITINDQEYTYRAKNSVIIVMGNDGQMMFPYEMDGDTLTVDVEGREVVYKRIKAGSADASNAAVVVRNATAELTGKWCYLSSLTGTNSFMSSRCFVLNANGTYEYSAESSTSGAAGGTASQSYDSGRWTANATSITAYSKTNGTVTYTLQKRNHPKTGDPMLIVDGDAFVTAYQRRPW